MTARTSFLPHLFVTLGLAGSTSLVAACGGRVVSLGSTGDSQDKLTSVDPATVAKNVPTSTSDPVAACPPGYAHPNICCDAAPGTSLTCGEWTSDPFRACSAQGPTWATYPNAFECCDLSNPTACIETPPDAGVPPPPPPIGCGFMCPPGWWPDTGTNVASSSSSSSGGPVVVNGGTSGSSGGGTSGAPSSGTNSNGTSSSGSTGSGGYGGSGGGYGGCCTATADGATICDGFGYAEPVATSCSGSSSGSVGIAPTPQPGPILLDDGGVVTEDGGPYDAGAEDGGPYGGDDGGITFDAGVPDCDAGNPYPPGYDGGVTSLCGACPPGWLMDAVDPLLCCQTTADGVDECFSQATGSATGIIGGGSVPPSSGGSTVGSAGGASSSSSSGGSSSPPVSFPATDAGAANGG